MNKLMQESEKKSTQDLEKEITNTKKEIAQLKSEWMVKPPKDTNIVIKKRKKLAVLLTILKSKNSK